MKIKFLRNHTLGVKTYKSGDEIEVPDTTGHKLILRNFALNANPFEFSAPSKKVMNEVLDEENGKKVEKSFDRLSEGALNTDIDKPTKSGFGGFGKKKKKKTN